MQKQTLISTSAPLLSNLILLSSSPPYSPCSHPGFLFLSHPTPQLSENPGSATLQIYPEFVYFSLSTLKISWFRTTIISQLNYYNGPPASSLATLLSVLHSAARITYQSLSQFILLLSVMMIPFIYIYWRDKIREMENRLPVARD